MVTHRLHPVDVRRRLDRRRRLGVEDIGRQRELHGNGQRHGHPGQRHRQRLARRDGDRRAASSARRRPGVRGTHRRRGAGGAHRQAEVVPRRYVGAERGEARVGGGRELHRHPAGGHPVHGPATVARL